MNQTQSNEATTLTYGAKAAPVSKLDPTSAAALAGARCQRESCPERFALSSEVQQRCETGQVSWGDGTCWTGAGWFSGSRCTPE